MEKILIAGGTGFIGQHLRRHWNDKEITLISRKKVNPNKNLPVSQIYTWEELQQNGRDICEQHDLIINLTGENIAEGRWTENRKKDILNSRIDSAQLFIKILQNLSIPPPFFNASAIGIYELHAGDHIPYTEETSIDYTKSSNFLAEIARAWEKATWTIPEFKGRIVNMRFGVVLGKDGGAFKKMVTPFYLGIGGVIGSGQQILTWVHINDVVRAIDFIYHHPDIHGAVNIVAPNAVPQKTFAKLLAKELHRPAFIKMPAVFLKFIFGEMAEELLLQGQHVYPQKLLQAGFNFDYPILEDAFKELLQRH